MIKTISTVFRESSNSSGKYNLSDICPHCKNSIQPIVVYAMAQNIKNQKYANNVAVMLQCPVDGCHQFFIDWFKITFNTYGDIGTTEKLTYTYFPLLKNELPKEINEKFPDFNTIYSQAIQAESYGLDQIAGVGYRKALEFLIKNYAIYLSPDNEESIKKDTLGKVISEHLTEFKKLQNLAKAATWIGNDETHFVRKHEDKDIQSMKKFIKSAATFISADLDADEAMEFIEAD